MLAGGSDEFYRRILGAPHRHFVRVEVWSGAGVQLEEDLTFLRGGVSATLMSRVARTLDLEVTQDLYPVDPGDLLAPFGNEIRAYRGVDLGDNSDTYVWQVFRGRIQEASQSSDGTCRIHCADRAMDVVDNAFVSPQNSQPRNSVFREFQRLVLDAVNDAEFGASDEFATLVRPLTWQYDRGVALDELATSVGAFWYPLADGSFVMRRYPWSVSGDPVVTLFDGTGGTVNGWEVTRNRADIYNVVTVTGERLNGDAPVYATASDTSAASATYVDGNFGVRSLLKRLQTPSTLGGAQNAAMAELQNSIAPVESWRLDAVPDAALELGDVIAVQANGRDVRQVVSSFTLPLDLSGSMVIQTRSQIINKLEA